MFDDPFVVIFPERNVEGEERWLAVGSAGDIVVVVVAHTIVEDDQEETIRIISARKATPSERKQYEESDR